MHLLIVALGSAGDVHPFLAIGQAAAARGHRVSVCTSPAFSPLVERCGLRFLALGSAADYAKAIADPALWNPRTSLHALWRYIAPTLDPLYELLLHETDRDTVVLGSLWAWSARVLQEKSGLPYLSAQVSPSTLLSAVSPPVHGRFTLPSAWPLRLRRLALWLIERLVIDRMMAPAVDRLRRRAGLPPVRRLMGRWMHSPLGVLALFPQWFGPPQSDWPSALTHTGFPLFAGGGDGVLDDDLRRFLDAGAAPVVVTAGSTPLHGTAFFSAALEAAGALGRRAVFLGGSAQSVPPLPGTACHRSHVPLAPLLARAAALIHHGGVGTAAFALAAGVPQLVMPFAHDQFDNAQRIVGLGCGLRLDAPALPAAMAGALRKLLTEPSFRAAAQEMRRRVLDDSGATACQRAVDLVEACALRAA